jgi:transcriptional regulator with XRE-family HTH domain
MSRPTTRNKTPAQQALIDLRQQLNMTQQDLAVAMNTTTTSVARWESSLSPHGRVLDQLARFAASQGLPEWEALFRRAIAQESFLKRNRDYFLTDEGLELQIAVANIYQFREHPKIARHFADMLDAIVVAHRQVAKLVKENTELLTLEDVMYLNGRLAQYQKQRSNQKPEVDLKQTTPREKRKRGK